MAVGAIRFKKRFAILLLKQYYETERETMRRRLAKALLMIFL
jgi:hypothetical protein